MKTPEQMAEEAINNRWKISGMPTSSDGYVNTLMIRIGGYKDGFIDGYQAAKDQLQPQPFHKGADVYIIDANNPLPKPMPLSIAEQVQFADADKVMNSSNNSNGWISVKERLPEDGQDVLVFDEGAISVKSLSSYTHKWHPYENGFDCEPSHWMPLPEAPKGQS